MGHGDPSTDSNSGAGPPCRSSVGGDIGHLVFQVNRAPDARQLSGGVQHLEIGSQIVDYRHDPPKYSLPCG